jgi:hypothetical protein
MSTHRHSLLFVLLAAAAGAHAQATSPRTTQEVRAELMQALRNGDVIANGETGLTLRELYPQRYGTAPASTLTRAAVLQQLQEAQRTGDLLADGDAGLKLNELRPQAYPPKEAVAGKTRAQAQAELREAIRTGNMLADDDTGRLLKDVYPRRYARVLPTGDVPAQADAGAAARQPY